MSEMVTSLRARPTTYKGIKMRSRLEALYAEHLDNVMQVAWQYEPECFAAPSGQYLPDFRVGQDIYIEVKPPSADHAEALRKMHIILESQPDAWLYVETNYGTYPDVSFARAARCTPANPCCVGRRVDGSLAVLSGLCTSFDHSTDRRAYPDGIDFVCIWCHSIAIDVVGVVPPSAGHPTMLTIECFGCCERYDLTLARRSSSDKSTLRLEVVER